jgi:hypothetical protein
MATTPWATRGSSCCPEHPPPWAELTSPQILQPAPPSSRTRVRCRSCSYFSHLSGGGDFFRMTNDPFFR